VVSRSVGCLVGCETLAETVEDALAVDNCCGCAEADGVEDDDIAEVLSSGWLGTDSDDDDEDDEEAGNDKRARK
jgi:hypothetical protein